MQSPDLNPPEHLRKHNSIHHNTNQGKKGVHHSRTLPEAIYVESIEQSALKMF